ncbi:sulfotransferase family 2 domain-containing protein [Roseinatronobacter bogoriensis]|uniref:Sulfotransferase family protein n=1 Tax=Roseinatronobacter bogoriensis subsp. barguzinensis TaxID=441209 RepID=A0A2K8K7B6_9RHOB|nr:MULTISPECIES: sulfotransferase family 2 domain-containing protein [Rhodobaca]ATX65329.1 hypothetical protein BG454_05410 [Rhodobaca barguzinensis]MBB4209861.1 hypothetical protein [Rhodobaca bogoriensis DSM 18756]TDW33042.1 sulfotransferase family protein [Rhodobaca barguzinensis]TDY65879.1 sulfotransferase family protein [Rhodobaca bogoriensis DSM 18756]
MSKQKNVVTKFLRAAKLLAKGARGTLALRANYGPVRMFAIRRVAVFPELGLAYNRIKKNANTSTMILLQQLSTGEVVKGNAAKSGMRLYFDLSAQELQNIGDLNLFIIIRNPYSRVLSAFLGKMKKKHYQQAHGVFDMTPEGFGKFLKWLENGGLTGDQHWDLQVKLMMLPLEKYDTVIRFEEYSSSMRRFLEGRGLNVPAGALEEYYPTYRGHETNASSKLTQFYTPERVEIVRRIYAKDFEALNYSTEFPDPLS